ncbi:MAG: hypothetical protein WBQ50_06320 [Nocardioides sp.]
MSPSLPLSARFALWFSAFAAGRASLDEARDRIVEDDAAHDVVELPGRDEPVPLILALGLLRVEGATEAGLALPAAGDPLGLGGPASFNNEVLEVGEGVVFTGADLGVVPHVVGAGVQWQVMPAASRRQLPDPSEAEAELRRSLLGASEALADLDVARWRPDVADELMALRRATDLVLPATMAPRAVRLAGLAARCRLIVDLALEDDGGAITASEADSRRAVLMPLDHAARRGLVAACAYPFAL